MTRPTTHIDWVSDDGAAKLVDPGTPKKLLGWVVSEEPPARFFNWLFNKIDKWLKLVDASAPDVVVGAGTGCTHATLAAALADAAVTTNVRVLLKDSATLAATLALSKAGWSIKAAPGVTLTAGAATTAMTVSANGVTIDGVRFSGFTTGIGYAVGGTYGRVLNCNFASCTTEVDDSLAPADKKPAIVGTIVEV